MRQDKLISWIYAVVAILVLLAFASSNLHWALILLGVIVAASFGVLALVFRKTYKDYTAYSNLPSNRRGM